MDDVQVLRQRSLTCAWDEDGSLVVRARLTPEQSAIWLKAIEKAEAALDDGDEFDVRHADAVTHALEESLNERPEPPKTSDRYQVVVHVSAETLCRSSSRDRHPADHGDDPAYIDQGPVLHPETVRRLTCDGALVALLEDGRGEVLNVGRKTRVIPWAVRRALNARDRHCRVPGLRAFALRGRPPHRSLGPWGRDKAREPRAALPTASPAGARARRRRGQDRRRLPFRPAALVAVAGVRIIDGFLEPPGVRSHRRTQRA